MISVGVIIVNTKELENSLGISRANLRFYEKEGLIEPRRKESNYRDYSKKDVEQIKKYLFLEN